jgi:hypothetical protein
MKLIFALVILGTSFLVQATELPVMEVNAIELRKFRLSTRFEVNLESRAVGVSLTGTREVGRSERTVTRTFEKEVSELTLVDDKLMLGDVECGTMGETRIFRRPVLHLSGKCEIKVNRTKEMIKVFIVTK